MIASTIVLNINSVTKQGTISCPTDFAALGINVVTYGAKIIGTVTGPDGVAIVTGNTGSPLINLAISTSSAPFDLPQDSEGNILNGDYGIDTQLNLSAENLDLGATTVDSTNYYFAPLEWISNFFEVGDAFVVSGAANAGNNGARVVASTTFVTPNSRLFVSNTLVSEALGGPGMAFNLSHDTYVGSVVYNGCDIILPTASPTYNCSQTQFGTLVIADTTVLPSTHVLTTRAWSVEYPSNLSPAPDTNPVTSTSSATPPSNPTVNFTELATGPWGYRLTHTVEVTQTDGLVYTYTKDTGALNFTVSCSGDLCSIIECFQSLTAQEQQDIAANGQSALTAPLNLLSRYALIAQSQQACGDSEALAATITTMQGIISSTGQPCDCGCTDTNGNQWVNNAGYDAASQLAAIVASIQYRLFNGVPGEDQDSTLGVQIGAIWQDYNTGIEYRCTDVTEGAAVWEVYYDPEAGGVAGVTGPTVDNTDPQNPIVGLPESNEVALSADIPQLPEAGNVQEALEALAEAITTTGPLLYVALLTQTSTGAPVATIIKNDLSGPIVWAYTLTGFYTGVLTSAFTANKTACFITNNVISQFRAMAINNPNANSLIINTKDAATGSNLDGVLNGTLVKIEVYP